ncbi:hypothetical protein [Caballeronia concitans]|uniref:PAAR repeat-containing protein n=1 Tax=Caballeronia concitans TaxID=1777133 RepID=A0A658QUB1_9BURK|nr:hypothetical protein [Caballeronia concitans]KIG09428.1 hypothetical protein BurMR1_3104 [Burkholderia sp. MR1]SAL22791.1 hypothetical protein AWB72_01626 [Caballeronia concitans]
MLRRAFLAKGDRADSAIITEGLPTVTCSNPPPLVHIATLEMRTYCDACKRDGYIAPRGPRHPETGPNGKQWALSGDINICGCSPAPVFRAERNMGMSFTSGDATYVDEWKSERTRSTTGRYDEQIVLRDEDGHAVAGQRYMITTDDGEIYQGVTDSTGATERVYTDHPMKLVIELLV